MGKIALYGIITVMISLIGLSLLAFVSKKRQPNQVNIAVNDVTIRDLFENYRFSNKVDLGQMTSFILAIDHNGFNGILADLRAQAVRVQDAPNKLIQRQAYFKFLSRYMKKREKFQRALQSNSGHTVLLQNTFTLMLLIGMVFLIVPILGVYAIQFDALVSHLIKRMGLLTVSGSAMVLVYMIATTVEEKLMRS